MFRFYIIYKYRFVMFKAKDLHGFELDWSGLDC